MKCWCPIRLSRVPRPGAARRSGNVPYALSREFQLDAKAFVTCLEAHPKAKVAVINHPSNPTGGGASLEELRAVAWACRQRGILLISDEVYRDLYFETRPPSLRDAGSYGVVLGSMSKGWAAPGLRVGWAVGDPQWLTPARTVHAFAVTAASAPCQRAALALLEASDQVLPQGRREISIRWEALASAWQEHFGEVLTPPAGAFYHWISLPEAARQDPMAFCLKLRDEAKVVLVPGTAFGEAGCAYARLSFRGTPRAGPRGCPSHGVLLEEVMTPLWPSVTKNAEHWPNPMRPLSSPIEVEWRRPATGPCARPCQIGFGSPMR